MLRTHEFQSSESMTKFDHYDDTNRCRSANQTAKLVAIVVKHVSSPHSPHCAGHLTKIVDEIFPSNLSDIFLR